MTKALPSDRDQIIALIEEETAAWLRCDLAGWAACWVHSDRAQNINARPSIGARQLVGFESIREHVAARMDLIAGCDLAPEAVQREDWQISIGSDMAWVTFNQVTPLDFPTEAARGRHNQMRILEKAAGQWKIVAIFHIPNRIGYYDSPWVRVDRHAQIVEMGAGAEEALRNHKALKVVGQRVTAKLPNDNRKLREVLSEATDLIDRRIGRNPVPLIFNNSDNLSISRCWVSIADMMIVILLDDEQLMDRSIDKAGALYRLTSTQMKVAQLIARGNDLTKVAELLGVRPNTVRTHVKRMFERVGVSSQPALMRALLSTEPPKL